MEKSENPHCAAHSSDRLTPAPKQVIINKNAWIGERSLILKGSEIGENSIIGAGSVVSGVVPPNVVYAGNPAKKVKELDKSDFKSREQLFSESSSYLSDMIKIDKKTLEGNTFLKWLFSIIWPRK